MWISSILLAVAFLAFPVDGQYELNKNSNESPQFTDEAVIGSVTLKDKKFKVIIPFGPSPVETEPFLAPREPTPIVRRPQINLFRKSRPTNSFTSGQGSPPGLTYQKTSTSPEGFLMVAKSQSVKIPRLRGIGSTISGLFGNIQPQLRSGQVLLTPGQVPGQTKVSVSAPFRPAEGRTPGSSATSSSQEIRTSQLALPQLPTSRQAESQARTLGSRSKPSSTGSGVPSRTSGATSQISGTTRISQVSLTGRTATRPGSRMGLSTTSSVTSILRPFPASSRTTGSRATIGESSRTEQPQMGPTRSTTSLVDIQKPSPTSSRTPVSRAGIGLSGRTGIASTGPSSRTTGRTGGTQRPSLTASRTSGSKTSTGSSERIGTTFASLASTTTGPTGGSSGRFSTSSRTSGARTGVGPSESTRTIGSRSGTAGSTSRIGAIPTGPSSRTTGITGGTSRRSLASSRTSGSRAGISSSGRTRTTSTSLAGRTIGRTGGPSRLSTTSSSRASGSRAGIGSSGRTGTTSIGPSRRTTVLTGNTRRPTSTSSRTFEARTGIGPSVRRRGNSTGPSSRTTSLFGGTSRPTSTTSSRTIGSRSGTAGSTGRTGAISTAPSRRTTVITGATSKPSLASSRTSGSRTDVSSSGRLTTSSTGLASRTIGPTGGTSGPFTTSSRTSGPRPTSTSSRTIESRSDIAGSTGSTGTQRPSRTLTRTSGSRTRIGPSGAGTISTGISSRTSGLPGGTLRPSPTRSRIPGTRAGTGPSARTSVSSTDLSRRTNGLPDLTLIGSRMGVTSSDIKGPSSEGSSSLTGGILIPSPTPSKASGSRGARGFVGTINTTISSRIDGQSRGGVRSPQTSNNFFGSAGSRVTSSNTGTSLNRQGLSGRRSTAGQSQGPVRITGLGRSVPGRGLIRPSSQVVDNGERNGSPELGRLGTGSFTVLGQRSSRAEANVPPAQEAQHGHGIPVDNGVVGEPEISCGPNSVTVNFNTQNNFEGVMFVKGLFANDDCKTLGGNTRLGSIELGFSSCNTLRERSLNPKGVFVSTTVIIQFHPLFITKVDQAVRVECFYMEADKTVSQELEVSMLTTGIQTLQVPMPVCRYDILDGGPNGDPVRFALVGQQVYHKWTCDTDTEDTFCMVVYGCFVSDGNQDNVILLDDNGCAQDIHLLNNLDYPTDLMAGQEAHVFKYADRPNLYFNCQIQITVKEPGEPCARPQCGAPSAGGRGGRGKRQVRRLDPNPAGVVDVAYHHPILVGDVDLNESDLPLPVQHGRRHVERMGYCMSSTVFSAFITFGAIALVSSMALAVFMYTRRSSKY